MTKITNLLNERQYILKSCNAGEQLAIKSSNWVVPNCELWLKFNFINEGPAKHTSLKKSSGSLKEVLFMLRYFNAGHALIMFSTVLVFSSHNLDISLKVWNFIILSKKNFKICEKLSFCQNVFWFSVNNPKSYKYYRGITIGHQTSNGHDRYIRKI